MRLKQEEMAETRGTLGQGAKDLPDSLAVRSSCQPRKPQPTSNGSLRVMAGGADRVAQAESRTPGKRVVLEGPEVTEQTAAVIREELGAGEGPEKAAGVVKVEKAGKAAKGVTVVLGDLYLFSSRVTIRALLAPLLTFTKGALVRKA